MANINSETPLRGDYLLLKKAALNYREYGSPHACNHLQLTLFVPLP